MSYELYKFFHLSLIIVFFTLASASFFIQQNSKKVLSISLAVLAILILVTGIGLIAKLNLGFPYWIISKLLLWLLLILGIPTIKKHLYNSEKAGLLFLFCIGIALVFLVIFRPL